MEYAAFLIAVFAVCISVVWAIHLLGYIDSESFLMIVFISIAFACSAGEAGIRSNFIIATVYTLLSILNLYLYFNTKRGV